MGFEFDLDEKKQLVYQFAELSEFDPNQLSGLLNIEVKEFIEPKKRFRDGVTTITYDTGNLYSLEEYVTLITRRGEVSSSIITDLLSKISMVIHKIDNYFFLEKGNIVLNEAFIFIDINNKDICCIYVPSKNVINTIEKGINGLIEFFTATTNESDEMILFTHKMNQYLNDGTFDLSEFITKIEGISLEPKIESTNNIKKHKELNKQINVIEPIKLNKVKIHEDIQQAKIKNIVEEGKSVSNKQENLKSNKALLNKESHIDIKDNNKNLINIALGQILIIILLGLIISTGVLNDDNGKLNIVNLIVLMVIIIGGVEFLIFKYFVKKKDPISQGIEDTISNKQVMSSKKAKQVKADVKIESSNVQRVFDKGTVVISNNTQKSNEQIGTVILKENKVPYFEVTINGRTVKKYIDVDPYLIGRENEFCDLIINNSAVSSVHAHIEKSEEGYVYIDKGSKNYSYINGKKIKEYVSYQLHDGDQINVANEVIKFKSM